MNDMDDATRPDGLRLGLDRPQPPPARPAPWNVPMTWNLPDAAPEDPDAPVRPLAALVSFHYLRAAVRRRWLLCVLPAVLGVLLGVAFLVATPALPVATTTLMLSHDERVEASRAIATDISLLATRTVAERTIRALGLSMRPEDLMDSVAVVPSDSSDILQLTMTGPTDAEALRRIDSYTKEYLDFRAKQVSAQSDILIKNYTDRIAALQTRSRSLSTRIQTLAASGDTATDRLSDAVTERSQFNGQIGRLQEAVQDATLRQVAIVSTSRVIDPPAPMSPSGPRRVVLVLASGLIGGSAMGFVLVVLQAILSDRLRLRIEVASALNTSVPLSVRRLTPLSRLSRILRFLPWVRALDTRCLVDRQRVAHAIEKAVPEPGRRQSLAVLCLGNSDEMRFGLVSAATLLQHHGRTATIIDLTDAGGVASAVARLAGAAVDERPEVFRPSVIPSLTKGPSDIDVANWDDVALAKGRNGVTLILADLDPAVGVDHLTVWTDDVMVAVTGGKSSVELVRTSGDLIRSSGLRLHHAVLLGAVRDDVSSGIAAPASEKDTEAAEPAGSRIDKSAGRAQTS